MFVVLSAPKRAFAQAGLLDTGSLGREAVGAYFTQEGNTPAKALVLTGWETLLGRWNIRGRSEHSENLVQSRTFEGNTSRMRWNRGKKT